MKCVLNLSGGAARSAFQAGAITSLHKSGFEFKRIFAVSGGIISGYFTMTGQVDFLESLWIHEIPRHANRPRWYAGAVLNIFGRAEGIVSPEFVEGLILRYIDRMPEGLTFRVVSLYTGRELHFEGSNFLTLADYRRAIYAGVAIPGVFQPTNLKANGVMFLDCADGGLYSPMIENVESLSDFPVVSILTHHDEIEIKRSTTAAQVAARALYLRDKSRQNVEATISPAYPLPQPWDFRKKSISASFYHGQEMGRQYVGSLG